jgi:RNA polymerase sigma factor (sigma-70 family)
MNTSFIDQSAAPSPSNAFASELRESRDQPVEQVLPTEEALAFLAAMKNAKDFGEYCDIRNQILVGHLPIVRRLVRGMVGKPALWEDLESEGARELIRAIDRYDPGHGAPFQAYAAACIRNRIRDELMSGEGFGIAGHAARNLHRLRGIAAAGNQPGISPSKSSAVPPRATRRLAPFVNLVSLDSSAGTDSDTPFGEIARVDPALGDAPANVLERLQMDEDLRILGDALRKLPWKERFVIERLYGLDGHPPRTQSEVAWLFGISRQRVSQIQAATLRRLRESGWGLD